MIDARDLELQQVVRCYWGTFDSVSMEVIHQREETLRKIRIIEPEATLTHHPAEGTYVVHIWGRELSKHWHSAGYALAEAYNRLIMGEEK